MISHPSNKGYDSKLLSEHLLSVASACKKGLLALDLNLRLIGKDELADVAFYIGLLHDVGKASSAFQQMISGNGSSGPLTHHSLISGLIAYDHFSRRSFPAFVPALAFKTIQRHHGNLDSLSALIPILNPLLYQTSDISRDVCGQIDKDSEMNSFLAGYGIKVCEYGADDVESRLESIADFDFGKPELEDAIELFLIESLLFSLLVDNDKFDAARLKIDDYSSKVGKVNFDPSGYIATRVKSSRPTRLNVLRDSLRERINTHPGINEKNKLYTLSAPTGIGKTLACLVFVNRLLQKLRKPARIIYCLPYTSIIDQNYEIYRELLEFNHPEIGPDIYKYILKHHHLEDYYQLTKDDPDYDYSDYLNENLIVSSWTTAFVISTFVQLFHSVIGNRNSLVRKFYHIVNSVILLDEIQNLDAQYYLLLRKIFKVLSQRFNTYVLLCTATQPFIFEPGTYVELGLESMFREELFNRVSLTCHPGPIERESLVKMVSNLEFSSLLVVVNTRKTALALYDSLRSTYSDSYNVFCLTTLQIPLHRLQIIAEIRRLLRDNKPVILISTQLIEAGVDLSFECVVRDFAPLDSIVQVAGRCNRSGEFGILGGKMHLVNISDENGRPDARKVYDGYLLAQTRACLSAGPIFTSSQFIDLTKAYYASLDLDAVSRMILSAIRELNYTVDQQGQLPVSKFKVIVDDYPVNKVYILVDDQADADFHALLKCLKQLESPGLDGKTTDDLRLELALLYGRLKLYQISVSDSDLAGLDPSHQQIEELRDRTWYVRQSNVLSFYSESTGLRLTQAQQASARQLQDKE